MKLSILTPTYNRAQCLPKLYESIKQNKIDTLELEWLIMDDGSQDHTRELIESFQKENIVPIVYFFQQNQGKMVALNNLVEKAAGDWIVECDSDDYFCQNAFQFIVENVSLDNQVYAYAFLKYDQNLHNIGQLFPCEKEKTTMFDLYFKQGEDGEKALVFNAQIRKRFRHELEQNEKFVTEARMYHKMDALYHIIGINLPLMICEYQKDGYTKNIKEIFEKNPYGYYAYFKELLRFPMKGVLFRKRLYIIKHYLLFCYELNKKPEQKEIKGIMNKILIAFLYFPGKIKFKTWKRK